MSILEYWKTDVTNQFKDFIEMSNNYNTSIESIENVISGIQNSTDSFVNGMSAICQQMDRVELATDENAQEWNVLSIKSAKHQRVQKRFPVSRRIIRKMQRKFVIS